MSPLQAFAVSLALGLLLASSVCLLFRRSLRTLLCELCAGEARAGFWLHFSMVGIVLATFFVATWFAPTEASRLADPNVVVSVFVRTLQGGVFGLLASLALLGLVLMMSIGSYNARARRDPPAPYAQRPQST